MHPRKSNTFQGLLSDQQGLWTIAIFSLVCMTQCSQRTSFYRHCIPDGLSSVPLQSLHHDFVVSNTGIGAGSAHVKCE